VVPGRGGAASVAGLTFVNWGEPIGCGGVAVFPDDWVVVDDDGAVLIPRRSRRDRRDRARAGAARGWIMDEVEKGASLPGLLSAECREQGALRESKLKHE
jgi:regulator of RNase E activity RraA